MKKTTNRKRLTIAIVSMLTLIVLVILLYIITGAITKYTGYSVTGKVLDKESELKSCLKEKDITLYINSENPMQTLKENVLYEYMDSIKIFNCLKNNQKCLEDRVSPPTWIINNNKIESDISLQELQTLSECEL